MRRFAGIAAVLFLLLLPLAACGGAEEKAGFDPEITLQALADAGAFSEELEELDGDTAFTLYGLGNSGLEREDLSTKFFLNIMSHLLSPRLCTKDTCL